MSDDIGMRSRRGGETACDLEPGGVRAPPLLSFLSNARDARVAPTALPSSQSGMRGDAPVQSKKRSLVMTKGSPSPVPSVHQEGA